MSSRLKGSPRSGLVAGTVAFFGGYAAVALYSITVNRLAPLLHLSIIQVGLLVAIPISTGALLRIPFSAWVETYGGRRILFIQLLIAAVGMLGIILSIYSFLNGFLRNAGSVYYLLLIFGALAGTGVSTFSSGITYVSYWYPKSKQGTALGAFAGFGNAAPGIFTAILPYALISLGLIGSYVSWLVFLLIVIAVFLLIGYDSYYYQFLRHGMPRENAIEEAKKRGQELFPSCSALQSLKVAAKEWSTWFLVIMYFTSFGGFEALTSWFPTYWTHYLKVSLVLAGLLTGVMYSLITALIRVPGGVLSDRWGGENTAIASYAVMIAGGLFIIFSRSFSVSLIGEILLAIGMGIANAAVFKLVPKYSSKAVGGESGWVGGLGSVGGLVLPPVLAAFVSSFGTAGYSAGFTVFVVLALVSIALSLVLRRKKA